MKREARERGKTRGAVPGWEPTAGETLPRPRDFIFTLGMAVGVFPRGRKRSEEQVRENSGTALSAAAPWKLQ